MQDYLSYLETLPIDRELRFAFSALCNIVHPDAS
jgi:hypothetical protein